MSDIKVLALDLDGTLTNDQKLVTPRTRAALDAAIEKGVTIVLASGRPTAGIQPLAEELGLDKKGGCILSYNGGKIVDCRTGETLVEKTLDPALVPELCAFAAAQDIAILTYNREGIVCERDKDEWANKECFTTKLPMIHVDDLASYVNYPVCKMLITLDPARRDAVCAAGQQQFAGRADLYPSSPFFIEAVPLGVAKDGSLAELLRRMGLTRENLMACGDGLNDRSMIAYAGVGVAMQNAEQPVKDCADYVTTADNNHDGVAEAIEKFILNLVLFDLEWNIGYQPYTFNYHGVQQTLRGEIVEIGAVKIDEDANVLDTFSIHLRPRIFRKLQHHIAKVTGLTQADLDRGEPIVQGLRRFMQWCGPDAEFAEWGLDDVPVLKQNLFLCNLDESRPTVWYDLQQVFLREHPRKEGEGMTLESVVTRMGVPMERPFHDALSDTLYTADVCRLLDLRAGLAAYPTEDEALRQSLCQTPGDYRDFTVFHGYVEQYAWRADPKISQMPCPECGTTLQPDEIWLKKGSNSWYTLCQCPSCTGSSNAAGQGVFQRYKLSRRDGLHWSFARCAQMPDAESLARWEKLRTAQLERMRAKAEKQAAEK